MGIEEFLLTGQGQLTDENGRAMIDFEAPSLTQRAMVEDFTHQLEHPISAHIRDKHGVLRDVVDLTSYTVRQKRTARRRFLNASGISRDQYRFSRPQAGDPDAFRKTRPLRP